MKELLKLHYNVDVEDLDETNQIIHFSFQNESFYLYPFHRTKEELQDIYAVCTELKSRNVPIATFILNKEGQLVTNLNNMDYILLKFPGNEDAEYNVIDMLKLTQSLKLSDAKSKLYRNNWSELWGKKIDYFEYQMQELGKDKKVVLNSISYYIGLAETAISYATNTELKYQKTDLEQVSLSHKRIQFPNQVVNYFNPLNFIFDLEERDIAEYIKSAFFKDPNEARIELKAFLSLRKLSVYGYQMFYARLLYPSYYFDIYESVMNTSESEEKLIFYIEKVDQYEIFLKQVYFEILKFAPIEKIDWIVNKKES